MEKQNLKKNYKKTKNKKWIKPLTNHEKNKQNYK